MALIYWALVAGIHLFVAAVSQSKRLARTSPAMTLELGSL
jgi:hypothetical protein